MVLNRRYKNGSSSSLAAQKTALRAGRGYLPAVQVSPFPAPGSLPLLRSGNKGSGCFPQAGCRRRTAGPRTLNFYLNTNPSKPDFFWQLARRNTVFLNIILGSFFFATHLQKKEPKIISGSDLGQRREKATDLIYNVSIKDIDSGGSR